MNAGYKALCLELTRRELARRSFLDYLAYVHGELWIPTAFSAFLARAVQEFVEEKTANAFDLLVIETPPQHGKSMTVTEALPSWFLGRNPRKRVILASYSDESAERFARRNREKIKRFGGNLWGISMGRVDRAQEFELSNGLGRMVSRGIMSGITGNPADLLIIDDPVKNREEADSQQSRDKLWNEWQNTLKTRLAAGAKVILIMTPWHEDDLRARLLRYEKNLRRIRLPVEAEEGDLLGRAPGEALCPELGKDARWLRDFKAAYLADPAGGRRAWTALYQCAPRTEEGAVVKRQWWRYFDPGEIREFGCQVISVDAAFKGAEGSDFVAITVWGKRGNDYYLRYCLNRRMDFPETVHAIRLVKQLFPQAGAVLIEDKANGPAIVQTLQREMFCIPVNPRGGKVSRANAVAPAIESGHVFLPEGSTFTGDFVDQWTAFPAGEHDDMVDSASQALGYLLFRTGKEPGGEVDWMQERSIAARGAFLGAGAYEVYV